jgi:hypothetical protein
MVYPPRVSLVVQVETFQRLNEQQRVAACGDHNKALMILAGVYRLSCSPSVYTAKFSIVLHMPSQLVNGQTKVCDSTVVMIVTGAFKSAATAAAAVAASPSTKPGIVLLHASLTHLLHLQHVASSAEHTVHLNTAADAPMFPACRGRHGQDECGVCARAIPDVKGARLITSCLDQDFARACLFGGGRDKFYRC